MEFWSSLGSSIVPIYTYCKMIKIRNGTCGILLVCGHTQRLGYIHMPESMKIVGAIGLGGLWAWHILVTILRCVQGYGI